MNEKWNGVRCPECGHGWSPRVPAEQSRGIIVDVCDKCNHPVAVKFKRTVLLEAMHVRTVGSVKPDPTCLPMEE